jgi:molybdenum cofactor guanylyltransferase
MASVTQRGEPLGVVLAGGAGRRIGGSKATVELNRRALISYPLEAVWRALGNVTVVAKIDTELPSLPGVTVWVEPQEPRHPLTGIVHALGMAGGRAVLICAGDMPFVSPALIAAIARADPGAAPAVIASRCGQLQPLLGCYRPQALELLAGAGADAGVALRDAVGTLDPVRFEVEDPDELFNVNGPAELLQAAGMLDRRRARAAGQHAGSY